MWPNPQQTADLVTFTEAVLNGKLNFLCSVGCILSATKLWGFFKTVKRNVPKRLFYKT